MFKYNDETLAKEITGSAMFDVLTNLDDDQRAAADSSYNAMVEETDAPLVLQVYTPKG
jgi:hypothetical protein